MKINKTETDELTRALIQHSPYARVNHDFVSKLEQDLLNSIDQSSKRPNLFNLFKFISSNMNKKLALALGVVLVVATGASIVYLRPNDVGNRGTGSGTTSPATTTYELQGEYVTELSEAQDKLDYTILIPTITVENESISQIKVGNADNWVFDSYLWISYSEGGDLFYKVSESSTPSNDPEKPELGRGSNETTQLQIFGETVTAYYFVTEQEEPSTSIARSYLTWEVEDTAGENIIRYEISEFGSVDRDELVSLAESFAAWN